MRAKRGHALPLSAFHQQRPNIILPQGPHRWGQAAGYQRNLPAFLPSLGAAVRREASLEKIPRVGL